jgi:ribonuclease E
VQVPVDVATYLLNEKRAEIHAIEARLKVNVVLIPNIYFETPNYSINRLRHDDVKLADVQASYQRVEKPSEEIPLPSTGQEAKPVRQQAAVRGIVPSQPAPVREQKVPPQPEQAPSLLDRIFGWFKQMGPEEKKVRPEPARTPVEGVERGRARRDRAETAERSGEAGAALNKAAQDLPQRVEKRSESKAQSERNGQRKQARPGREERVRAEVKLPGAEEYASEELPQQEEASRRRRRGGRQRERGERGERALRENKQLTQKHPYSRPTAEQLSQAEGEIESAVPQPLPELPQESPALVLASAELTA